MTNYEGAYFSESEPEQPEPTPAVKCRRWPWIVGIAVAFVLGLGAGSLSTEDTTTAAGEPEPAPTATVTVTAEPPVDAEPAETDKEPEKEKPAPAEEEPSNTIGAGTWVVGTDIEPGQYRTEGPTDEWPCGWTRLSGLSGEFDDIISNGLPEGPTTVEVSESDEALELVGSCEWELVE